MDNYVLIGAAGYIAPRHMEAIKVNGGNLVGAYDPFDSVGIIDRYFPEASFFTEFERFDRYVDLQIRNGISIDYVVVCSPNYLHDSHIRFGLRIGADVICEKPLVLTEKNLQGLIELEGSSRGKVFNILQLRLHDSAIELRKRIKQNRDEFINVDFTYITSRGRWYLHSWKGDIDKSGGIATNIGIHFFDMLIWIFGDVKENVVKSHNNTSARGVLNFENASVNWFLSIDSQDLPLAAREQNMTTFRSMKFGEDSFEFSSGFTDLHVKSYQKIINGEGFRLTDSGAAIAVAEEIRNFIISK